MSSRPSPSVSILFGVLETLSNTSFSSLSNTPSLSMGVSESLLGFDPYHKTSKPSEYPSLSVSLTIADGKWIKSSSLSKRPSQSVSPQLSKTIINFRDR